jgi:X-X-X-Leu-X-X-Gly heptad repeat protein
VVAVVIVAGGEGTHRPTTNAATSQAKLPSPSARRPASVPPVFGPSQAASGASQAASGASQAASGASQAASGASQAASGASQAASGASRTSSGHAAAGQLARQLSSASAAANAPAAETTPAAPLQPPANGRKAIQGAQLSLKTAANRVEQVAQEVFVVVGQVRGIVTNSNVTATGGPGGYAQFQLSIPSSSLSQAMASLSSLRYAKVVSRTDTTQDVNDQYEADVRALADARALRTSLLKRLARATTQAQINSLTARIHDAEASISSDQATLRRLQRQVNLSQVSLTVNGGPLPVAVSSHSGGFGLGRAAHDAGRVLTVAAGIALIAAAVLVPVSLLAAFGWWIGAALKRRRRDQALDLI